MKESYKEMNVFQNYNAEVMVLSYLVNNPQSYRKIQESDFANHNCRMIFKQIRLFEDPPSEEELLLSDDDLNETLIRQLYKMNNNNIEYWVNQLFKASFLRLAKKQISLINTYIDTKPTDEGEDEEVYTDFFENCTLSELKEDIIKSYEPFLDACRSTYNIKSYYADELKRMPVSWVIEDMVYTGDIHNIVAPRKAGKSFFAHELAWHVQNGVDFLGKHVNQCDVIYADFELGQNGFANRADACSRTFGDTAHYEILEAKGVPAADVCDYIAEAHKQNPNLKLAIFDCFYKFNIGKENEEKDVKDSLRPLEQLAKKNDICVIYVHHTTKAGNNKKDALLSSSGSVVHARVVGDGITLGKMNDNGELDITITGREIIKGSYEIHCVKNEAGVFVPCEKKAEIEKTNRTGFNKKKSPDELRELYPSLCEIIGDEGATLAQIKRVFANEDSKTLKEKGFTYISKKVIGDERKTGRYYLN